MSNTVMLTGRISAAPELRVLPSGDRVVVFRLVVPRAAPVPNGAGGVADGRRHSDWFTCAVWGGRVMSSCRAWQAGDTVAVQGQLRRRHYRVGELGRSVVEVVVVSGRRVRRVPVA